MEMFKKLDNFNYETNMGLINMTGGFFACFLNNLLVKEERAILVVTPSLFEARNLFNKFTDNKNVVLFENDDMILADGTAISPELKVDRINILNDLVADNRKIVFTDASGYVKFLPDVSVFKENKIVLKEGSSVVRDKLITRLNELGYTRDTLVSKMGDFALRGFVLDIFPVNCENPVRIEFFGDDIESIRYFDVSSQRSNQRLESLEILPYCENFSGKKAGIVDYLNRPIVIFKDYEQLKFSYDKMVSEALYYDDKKRFFDFYDIKVNDVLYYYDTYNVIEKDIKKVYDGGSFSVPCFNENFKDINNYVNKCLNEGKTVVIFTKIVNINYFLDNLNFSYVITNKEEVFENKVNIIREKFGEGFSTNNYVVLTDYELFARKNVVVRKSKFKNTSRIKDLSNLSVGDYVVHEKHGIGVYNGIKVINKGGHAGDYLEILYAKGDKLYIPASKINYISKYTGKDGYKPHINALNSSNWEKTKRRIREKIKYESKRLLKVQAERQMKRGFAFSPDQPLQFMFEKEFMYEETSDQLEAIKDIKRDMESKVPMDRILCGDVGYGKTEVAFRAMFKAVLDNKQVLYLCPTTLLSKQQYEVALERFKNYPVNIGILNRFVSSSQAKKTIEGLKSGNIDILFGTHRILSDDVVCKDLGLLVIDEEQRFGVIHKEKIKELKANVDVLTLTATPIPRTLQMAILGIKNLSLIETPPKNRKSVVTYVTRYDKKLLRDVIYKEVSRGGQVFILYNKVVDIEEKLSLFRKLVPNVKMNYVHGQMDKNIFEDVMNDFIDGKFDVLLCTTIIETGIDIPNVNTLVVLNADRFGLSQLYQIRGRVGRSDALAYAYLMYEEGKVLTETAVKRLKAIKDFTALGSGLSIATRDLAIRGAGDILGVEQAGFIDAVGIDLYTKMLNEEVAILKGEINEVEDTEKQDIDKVNVTSHIKDSYVSDEDIKIEIHKLINSIDSFDKLNSVRLEIEDRFGSIDNDLEIYMQEELFSSFVNKLGIIKVFDNNIYREIIFDKEKSSVINYEELFVKSLKINKNFKFSYKNNMLAIRLYYNNCSNHLVFDFNKILKEL